MKGYYKAPELTKEAVDEDGWFHTGDMGHLENGTLLKISGRKKSIFKNSFGKYINPDFVENILKDSPFIDNAMVVGENEKFCAALIVPDFMHLNNWSKENNISFSSIRELISKTEVVEMYKKEILKINKQLSSTEKVSNFFLMDSEWSVDSGELSAALKVKRFYVSNKYKKEIDSLFT